MKRIYKLSIELDPKWAENKGALWASMDLEATIKVTLARALYDICSHLGSWDKIMLKFQKDI